MSYVMEYTTVPIDGEARTVCVDFDRLPDALHEFGRVSPLVATARVIGRGTIGAVFAHIDNGSR